MVSTTIVHVIGSTAFIALIAFTIMHTSYTMKTMENELIYNNYKRVADSISVQILYCLSKNNNAFIRLEYPVTIGYEKPYNIIIGTGDAISSDYPFISELESDKIYVVVISMDNTIYAYKPITNTLYNEKVIILLQNPVKFGSTTLTYINITILGNLIYMDFIVKGVIYR